MRILHTEIVIERSAEDVWAVLTDFSNYPKWNPFLTSVSGTLKTGEKLEVTAHPSSSVPRTFFPTVMSVVPGKEFTWLGRFYLPGLLDGHHIFHLERLDTNRTRFLHDEVFRGGLMFLHLLLRWKHTELGFNEMNQALKTRCENQSEERAA